MLDPKQVPVEQSALLVIDAQDSFKVGPRWARRNNPGFEKMLALSSKLIVLPICLSFSSYILTATRRSPKTAPRSS
jgi:hypothetical protein